MTRGSSRARAWMCGGVAALLAMTGCAADVGAAPPAALASRTLADRFARPEETLEYHFMLDLPALRDSSLAADFAAHVAAPLAGLGSVAAPGPPGWTSYLDSRAGGLARRRLIVRLRRGHVTVKARAASPGALLDLPSCSGRKYEIDQFVAPEYSISSDVPCDGGDAEVLATGSVAAVWSLLERRCPDLWHQLRPAVSAAGRIECAGPARTYDAAVTLEHPAAGVLASAAIAVWFFPPSERQLVELSFTGHVRDRERLEALASYVTSWLSERALLARDQRTKTEQCLSAYLRPHPGARPDTISERARSAASRGAARP